MTTYIHRITVDDNELMALKAALEHYKEFCDGKLEANPQHGPYWAQIRHVDAILKRLYDDSALASWNTFV